jgi:arginine exporter protein ArgO
VRLLAHWAAEQGGAMRRAVTGMLVTAVVLLVGYWSIWFSHRDWLASEHTASYYAFEDAFPLADGLLAVACVLALVALHRRSPIALLWLLAGGGAGIYLFGMDLLYDLEHGTFAKGAGGATEAVIVAVELAFSVALLRWSWTHRAELLTDDSSRVRRGT